MDEAEEDGFLKAFKVCYCSSMFLCMARSYAACVLLNGQNTRVIQTLVTCICYGIHAHCVV